MVGPGKLLTHLRVPVLRILLILLTESAKAFTAVHTAASAAFSISDGEIRSDLKSATVRLSLVHLYVTRWFLVGSLCAKFDQVLKVGLTVAIWLA